MEITTDSAASVDTHDVVASLLDPPTSLPVADIGAGYGNFTARLVSLGYEALAVDIDPEDYKRAGLSPAPFVQANLDEELPLDPESIAGLVCIEAVEHLEAPLRSLRLMTQAVAPGGFLILTTPNVSSLGSRLELLVRGHHEDFDDYCYKDNGHISPVSITQMRRMAGRLGLDLEVETYNVGRLPVPKLHQRPLRGSRWRRRSLGETLIVRMRKTGSPRVAGRDYLLG